MRPLFFDTVNDFVKTLKMRYFTSFSMTIFNHNFLSYCRILKNIVLQQGYSLN